MYLYVFLVVFLCLPHWSSACQIQASGVSDQDKQEIVKKHNEYRAKVANGMEGGLPKASNMLKMVWDDNLAGTAQEWANQCEYAHTDPREKGGLGYEGQNIALQTNSEQQPNWDEPMRMWYDEVKDYNADTLSAYEFNPETSHFTQIVWADTNSIGCGYVMQSQDGWNNHFYGCNYGPGGNLMGEPMYKTGDPCSACGGCGSVQGLCDKEAKKRKKRDADEDVDDEDEEEGEEGEGQAASDDGDDNGDEEGEEGEGQVMVTTDDGDDNGDDGGEEGEGEAASDDDDDEGDDGGEEGEGQATSDDGEGGYDDSDDEEEEGEGQAASDDDVGDGDDGGEEGDGQAASDDDDDDVDDGNDGDDGEEKLERKKRNADEDGDNDDKDKGGDNDDEVKDAGEKSEGQAASDDDDGGYDLSAMLATLKEQESKDVLEIVKEAVSGFLGKLKETLEKGKEKVENIERKLMEKFSKNPSTVPDADDADDDKHGDVPEN